MRPAMLSLLALLAFSTLARAEDAKPAADKPDQAALEKKFEETLTNAALVGTFTMRGKDETKLHQERYVISSVKKVEGESWLFMARIQYGKHDATLPLILKVKWAGDTPVITLDKFRVPGFGSFTCRILIYDNQYAGTWDGGDHGGQMFGRIERADAAATKKPDASPEKVPEKTPAPK